VSVQLTNPSFGERFGCSRLLPLKLAAERIGRLAATALSRQRREQLSREEMAM
jgi:hypothetical protein